MTWKQLRVRPYGISDDLWQSYVREGRVDWANHDFVLGESVREDDVPPQYGRVRAVCKRCGEKRLVFHGVEMRILNHGWCLPWWRRLPGRGRA